MTNPTSVGPKGAPKRDPEGEKMIDYLERRCRREGYAAALIVVSETRAHFRIIPDAPFTACAYNRDTGELRINARSKDFRTPKEANRALDGTVHVISSLASVSEQFATQFRALIDSLVGRLDRQGIGVDVDEDPDFQPPLGVHYSAEDFKARQRDPVSEVLSRAMGFVSELAGEPCEGPAPGDGCKCRPCQARRVLSAPPQTVDVSSDDVHDVPEGVPRAVSLSVALCQHGTLWIRPLDALGRPLAVAEVPAEHVPTFLAQIEADLREHQGGPSH